MSFSTYSDDTDRAQQLTALRAEARRRSREWIEKIVMMHGVVMLCDLPPDAVTAALKDTVRPRTSRAAERTIIQTAK